VEEVGRWRRPPGDPAAAVFAGGAGVVSSLRHALHEGGWRTGLRAQVGGGEVAEEASGMVVGGRSGSPCPSGRANRTWPDHRA